MPYSGTALPLPHLLFRNEAVAPLPFESFNAELIAPDQFMSYEDMKVKLDRALGLSGDVSTATAESIADDNSSGKVATATDAPWADTPEPVQASGSAEGTDESMSYFEKLAEEG